MLQEIVYTSAPQGLQAGSSGFCTVAATKGMRPRMIQLLELLSSYRHAGPAAQNTDSANLVVHAHLHVSLGKQKFHLLSRIADAGLDYSRRSNLIAHHVALLAASVSEENPASVLQQTGLMRNSWKGDSKWLEPRELPIRNGQVGGICHRWQSVTGDAGWGGVLAATAMTDRTKPAYIVFNPGTPVLELIEESLGILPSAIRWQIPFSTYFTKLPTEASCLWRCVVEGSPEAVSARRSSGPLIDLCGPLSSPPPSAWVDSARSGRPPTVKAQTAIAPASHRTAAPTRQEYLLQSAPTSVLKTEQHSRPAATSTVPSVATPPKLPTSDPLPGTVGWSKIVIPAAVFAVFIAIGTSAGLIMSWRSEREDKVAAIERRVDALKDQVDKLNRATWDLEKTSRNVAAWKSSVDTLQVSTNEVKHWVATNIAQRNGEQPPPDQQSNMDDPSKIAESVNRLELLKQKSQGDFDKAADDMGVDHDLMLPDVGFVLPRIERLSAEYAEDRKQVEALLSEIERLCGPFDSEASSDNGEIGLLAKEALEEIDRSAESLRDDEKLRWAKDLVVELEKVSDPPNLDEPLKMRKMLADLDSIAVQVSDTAHAALSDLRDEHRGLTDLLERELALASSTADSGRPMGGTANSPFENLGAGTLGEIHSVPLSSFGEDWVAPTEIARLTIAPRWLVLRLAEVSGFELQPKALIEPVAEDSQESFGIWRLDIEGEVGRFELRDDMLSFRWDEVSKRAATARRTTANRLPSGLLSLTYRPATGASTTALLPLHSVLSSPAFEVRQNAKTPPGRKFILPYKDRSLKMKLVNRKLSPGWRVLSGEGKEIVVELDFSRVLAQATNLDAWDQEPNSRFALTALQKKPPSKPRRLPSLPGQKATLTCRIHLTDPKELPDNDTGISRFEYRIEANTQVHGAGNKAHVPWEDFLARVEQKALDFIRKKDWVEWPEAKDRLENQAESRQDKLAEFIGKEVIKFNVRVVRTVSVDGKKYEVPAYLMVD